MFMHGDLVGPPPRPRSLPPLRGAVLAYPTYYYLHSTPGAKRNENRRGKSWGAEVVFS